MRFPFVTVTLSIDCFDFEAFLLFMFHMIALVVEAYTHFSIFKNSSLSGSDYPPINIIEPSSVSFFCHQHLVYLLIH